MGLIVFMADLGRQEPLMAWFKMSSGVLHNPVLSTLTKEQKCDFIHLLCLAAESDVPGTIALETEDVAATLGLEEAAYIEFEEKLARKQVLERDDDGLTIFSWDDLYD